MSRHECGRDKGGFIIIRLGLNVALIHQNRSYRDSETKGNVIEKEAEMRKRLEEDSDN